MATTYGITATGFVMPQLVDIQNAINAQFQATFGADVNLGASSIFGQLSGIFAEREMLVWEAMGDVYNSEYPDTAFGVSLDNVGALTNIKRLGPLASTITAVNLFGTVGTLIPGTTTQFSVVNQPTSLFATNTDVTLAAGQNCIQTITFSLVPDAGTWNLVINGGETTALGFGANAAAVQAAVRLLPFCSACTVTGDYTAGFTITFLGAATGGLMFQPQFTVVTTLTSSSTVVTVTPMITQAGVAQATVDVTATAFGSIVANIGTLTVIATPVSGLTNVVNLNPSIPGRIAETDNAYRLRRSEELQITGGGTFNALVSKLINLSGVTAVVLFENYTNATDGNGVPPHAFEAFVQGGTAQDIGNAIFATKPVGIQPYGTNLVEVTDSQGNEHDIYYSVPTQVPVYTIAQISAGSNYPANGDALVVDALVAYGQSLSIGETLIVTPQYISSLVNIPGINAVTLLVGKAPDPTMSANLTFAANEVSEFDPEFVTVQHV